MEGVVTATSCIFWKQGVHCVETRTQPNFMRVHFFSWTVTLMHRNTNPAFVKPALTSLILFLWIVFPCISFLPTPYYREHSLTLLLYVVWVVFCLCFLFVCLFVCLFYRRPVIRSKEINTFMTFFFLPKPVLFISRADCVPFVTPSALM